MMKKALTLAMVLALGVTASAYAANAAEPIKICGEVRAHYGDSDVGLCHSILRTRINLQGQFNENWSLTARLQNEANLVGDSSDEDTEFKLAYVSGKLGGVKFDAGRQSIMLNKGNIIDGIFDGVKATYGEEVKLTVYAGSSLDIDIQEPQYKGFFSQDDATEIFVFDAATKLGATDVYATYSNAELDYRKEIFNIGAGAEIAQDLVLNAEYAYGESSDKKHRLSNHGWNAGLAYKGAKEREVGTWGVSFNYFDIPASTYIYSTNSQYSNYFIAWAEDPEWEPYNNDPKANKDGYKGFEIAANYTLAKNLVATVRYFDLTTRREDLSDQAIWSEVVYRF